MAEPLPDFARGAATVEGARVFLMQGEDDQEVEPGLYVKLISGTYAWGELSPTAMGILVFGALIAAAEAGDEYWSAVKNAVNAVEAKGPRIRPTGEPT
jgi:hypothetical protein